MAPPTQLEPLIDIIVDALLREVGLTTTPETTMPTRTAAMVPCRHQEHRDAEDSAPPTHAP
jgi:hypothetical protein